ncbi:hypothetical protein ACLIA0_05735 [Bacillaceae bacterium W0354]
MVGLVGVVLDLSASFEWLSADFEWLSANSGDLSADLGICQPIFDLSANLFV